MANYSEYLIEYDDVNLIVYLSGLDPNGFWDEISSFDDVNESEDFAEGLKEGLTVFTDTTVTVVPFVYEDEDNDNEGDD